MKESEKIFITGVVIVVLAVSLITGILVYSSNAQSATCKKLHMPETINGAVVQGAWPNGTSYAIVRGQNINGAWIEYSGMYPNGTAWHTITMFGLAGASC